MYPSMTISDDSTQWCPVIKDWLHGRRILCALGRYNSRLWVLKKVSRKQHYNEGVKQSGSKRSEARTGTRGRSGQTAASGAVHAATINPSML